MGKRGLERRLSRLDGFDEPRADLEQYATPADVAAHIVHRADLQGDLRRRTVVDLGAGTGLLALGAALRGPDRVLALELDADALAIARENEHRLDDAVAVDWVQADATMPPLPLDGDVTVLTNPPFGAQDGNEGADRAFLAAAAALGDVSYSIHNAGSQSFVEAFVADNGGTVTHAFEAAFAVDRQFGFHTEARRELAVEVYRVEWSPSP
jgi:putative methylase